MGEVKTNFPFFYMIDFDNYIFDFGGVLISIDYQRTIDKFNEIGFNSFEEAYSQGFQNDLFDSFEKGEISSQRFINAILEYLPKDTSPNSVIHAWNSMLGDLISVNLEFVQGLKHEGKRIFLLSNTNEIHIDLAFKRWSNQYPYPPHELFDHIYLSHEIGLRKPMHSIYEKVVLENNLDPSKTIFIDDSIQHVKGAKEYGIHAMHVKTNSCLVDYFS